MATAPRPATPAGGDYDYTLPDNYQLWPHNLKAAWLAASHGFYILPCSESDRVADGKSYRAKQPLIPTWQANATRDPAQLRRWWARWPSALPALHLERAALIVIDADRHGGPDGVANFEKWAAQNKVDLTGVPTVKTPNDGSHYYFRRPNGFGPTNATGSLPAAVDVRGAGYVIAPHAILPDGRKWTGPDTALANASLMPPPLIAALGRAKGKFENCSAPLCELDTDASISAATVYLNATEGAVEGQAGDQHTYGVACHMRDFGVSEMKTFDLMAEIWNQKCSPPWGLDELALKVGNAYKYGQNPPGIASPSAVFGDVHVDEPDTSARFASVSSLSWADDAEADQQMQWLLKGLLPRRGVAILYGPAKSGKSFVALDLAARLGAQLPWFDLRCPKERVGTVMLLGEGGGTVRTRIKAVMQAWGGDCPPLAWGNVDRLASASGQRCARKIIEDAIEGMKSRGVRLGLIVVDTLASAFGFNDENSATEVTGAMKFLDRLAVEFDLSILGIHHSGKNGQDRGSSAFRASCDAMFSIERVETIAGQRGNLRRLSIVLNRNGDDEWSANFKLTKIVLGFDEDGDEVSSCVIQSAGEPAAVLKRRQVVLAQFDPALLARHGVELSNGRLGMTRKRLVARFAEIWDDLSKDALRKAVNRAVADLVAAGCVEILEESGVPYFVAISPQISDPFNKGCAT